MFYVQRGLVELIVWHVWLKRKFQKQTIKFNEVEHELVFECQKLD